MNTERDPESVRNAERAKLAHVNVNTFRKLADEFGAVYRERLLKLEYSHIAYVLGCLQENTRKVGNIKSYLLISLYNAALTIDNYYRAEVNHDLYGSG